MKNKIFIVTLCIVFIVSLIIYKKDKSEFTKSEFEKLNFEVVKYFENEKFDCEEEFVQVEYEAWLQRTDALDSEKYNTPIWCKKKVEKMVDGNNYISEIKYKMISFEDMIYYKEKSKTEEFSLYVESSNVPQEQILSNDAIIRFYQQSKGDSLNMFIDKYDEEMYNNMIDTYRYLGLINKQNDDENYKYYQNIFKNGLPYEVKNDITVDESDYFDLIVEKSYADNLLNEFKVNKEEADEIAKRFEKSKIYDKIYNLKY